MAGMIAKYLAMSLAIENCQRSSGDEELLADLHDLDEFRRVGSRSTMLPALSPRRTGVHGHADIGLGKAGASLASPVIATSLPPLSLRSGPSVFRGGFGEEVIDAGLFGDGRVR